MKLIQFISLSILFNNYLCKVVNEKLIDSQNKKNPIILSNYTTMNEIKVKIEDNLLFSPAINYKQIELEIPDPFEIKSFSCELNKNTIKNINFRKFLNCF